MDLTSAINLLSNGEFENQKTSVYAALRALISTFCLFPLDGAGGFGGYIVNYAVYVFYLVCDTI